MYNIDVFLCQSDKEKHVRIGEISISPILKLFAEFAGYYHFLINGSTMTYVTAIELALFGASQDRRICHMSVIRRSVGYAGALEERLIALRVAKELITVQLAKNSNECQVHIKGGCQSLG